MLESLWGESFMVSLALALGLAQMSGNTRFDSLFLDEGFGTLDENSLEQVLDCLQNLHERGKTVGIISHVEQLNERISSQIRVTPIGCSGYSTLDTSNRAIIAKPSRPTGNAARGRSKETQNR